MSENKFTPAPWRVEVDTEGVFVVMDALYGSRPDGSGHDNDEMLPVYASTDPEQREADADLIAAAPDLLHALVKLRKAIDQEWENGSITGQFSAAYLACEAAADAAIAQARGEQVPS